MKTAAALVLLLPLSAACASRGGYAEPGPTSASANPPAPASVQTGQPLQPSPADGRPSAVPPMVGPGGNNIPSHDPSPDGECATNADCVPAACCHATACAPRASAPRCDGQVCTQNCAPGTLDCGQAACVCLGGRCGVQRRG
jgi:hypothetical protein